MNYSPIQHITLAKGLLAYRQAGTGLPLLLIHGWRCSSRHWQGTLDYLADAREVYAIDLPGHGETPPWGDPITTTLLAREALEFADRLGLERFDLVGHSFGSAVAVGVAALVPTRVRRLVLTSLGTARNVVERATLTQAHQQMDLALSFWRPLLALSRDGHALWKPWIEWAANDPVISRAVAGAFVEHLPEDETAIRDGVVEFFSTDPLSALEVAITAGSPEFFPALTKVLSPVLLVTGDQDPLMPVSAVEAIAERLADCRLACLDRCGHLPMIEQPDTYHRLVREFLLNGE